MGHEAVQAGSGGEGVSLFKRHSVDFVISDLKMDGMDGTAVLAAIRDLDPDCPTMIITAFGTVETAVEAMKLGAYDFLEKPFSPEVVQLKIDRALQFRHARRAQRRLESENDYLKAETQDQYGALIGQAATMQTIFRALSKVAATESTVLIQGESGTGKELAAHAVHTGSRRESGPFIKVNCGALADSLLESELFGHERGAFTGALKRRLGRFELADGGTIFLDEIGDISPSLQTKLLRVLQQREFERVGGESTIKVDVRVVSATNKDLKKEVADGRFREDLFYRLHIVPIVMPPLRDRKDDIPLLAQHFIEKLRHRANQRASRLTDDALARLMAYHWPGNVRELENVIEQALVFSDSEAIPVAALPEFLRGDERSAALTLPGGAMSLPEILDDLERQLIVKAYREANGVKTETAKRLGIKTSALYYKLEKYGIESP